jgi:GGDEF domain-containing protein
MDSIYADLRVFIARANEELRRARRYATFVSLIAIDLSHLDNEDGIENFSGFGEFMLSMQKLVRSSIRDTDLLGASSNKEIYILLIETPGEGAQALSQRLQSSLRYFICNNIRSPIKWRVPMRNYSFPQSTAGQPDLQSLLGELG